MTAWNNPHDVRPALANMVRRDQDGVWRAAQPPRPTKLQRAVLSLMMKGDALTIDDAGVVRLRDSKTVVNPKVYQALVENCWVEPPLAEYHYSVHQRGTVRLLKPGGPLLSEEQEHERDN
jgi:hypothetical protein